MLLVGTSDAQRSHRPPVRSSRSARAMLQRAAPSNSTSTSDLACGHEGLACECVARPTAPVRCRPGRMRGMPAARLPLTRDAIGMLSSMFPRPPPSSDGACCCLVPVAGGKFVSEYYVMAGGNVRRSSTHSHKATVRISYRPGDLSSARCRSTSHSAPRRRAAPRLVQLD